MAGMLLIVMVPKMIVSSPVPELSRLRDRIRSEVELLLLIFLLMWLPRYNKLSCVVSILWSNRVQINTILWSKYRGGEGGLGACGKSLPDGNLFLP